MERLVLKVESFIKDNLKVKFQLFLLPILIIILFFNTYNFDKKEVLFKSINYDKLKMKSKILEIVQEIDIFCKQQNIKINKIKSKRNSIYLNTNISLMKIGTFVHFIENINNFSNILNFKLTAINDKFVNLDLHIDFSKYFLKKLDKKLFLQKIQTEKINSLKLKAVLNNYAFINNSWYKKNDVIYGLKLVSIKKDTVILKRNNKTYKIGIFENENFK